MNTKENSDTASTYKGFWDSALVGDDRTKATTYTNRALVGLGLLSLAWEQAMPAKKQKPAPFSQPEPS